MNFTGHRDAIRCLQADSRRVVSGSYDSTAGVWDMAAGKRLWELKGHTDSITTLQFDESDMLVTSSFDQSFRGEALFLRPRSHFLTDQRGISVGHQVREQTCSVEGWTRERPKRSQRWKGLCSTLRRPPIGANTSGRGQP